MNKKTKLLLIVISSILSLFILSVLTAIGTFVYYDEYHKTEILQSTSDDGIYNVTVYMIGSPQWSFGSAQCRLYLKNDKKIIAEKECSVSNDGAPARPDNFNISWYNDCARITITGDEMGPATHILYFDGTVDNFSRR